jgi:phospholipase/carboxylesterase
MQNAAPPMTSAAIRLHARPARVLAFLAACSIATVGCDRRAPGAQGTPAAPASAGQLAETTEAPLRGTSAGIGWIEIVTGGARATDPLPLIVGLHGYGSGPKHFIEMLAPFPGRARVVAMRGPISSGKGFAWFLHGEGGLDSAATAEAIGEAAEKLAPAIVALAHERPTVGLPIVTGFSQGGAMSFAIAARHPEVIAAAFPLSGWLPPALAATPPSSPARPPVFAFHGTADDRVPFDSGKAAVARLLAAGYHAELLEIPGVAHTVGPAERIELYQRIQASIAAAGAGAEHP